MQNILKISNTIKIIGDLIITEFLPIITGGVVCSTGERRLLALPPKPGGLGIPLFSDISDTASENLKFLTKT